MSSMVGRRQGWYADPDDAGRYNRYWTGEKWTKLRGRTRNHPDRIRVRRQANMVAAACLMVFLLATFLRTSVDGVSCGTWLSPNTLYSSTGSVFGNLLASDATQQCASKLDGRRLLALIALAVGLLVKYGWPYATRQEFDQ